MSKKFVDGVTEMHKRLICCVRSFTAREYRKDRHDDGYIGCS